MNHHSTSIVATSAPEQNAAKSETTKDQISEQIAQANAAMASLENKLRQGGVVVTLGQKRMMSQFRAAVNIQLECTGHLDAG